MELANIFPIKNQSFYRKEKYVMLLAHLLDEYDPKYFNRKQFIILDNGLYENAQVSTNLKDLVIMAENSRLPISEIVIPDKFFDLKETKKLFLENLRCIEDYQDTYSFMFVAQSKNLREFKKSY